MISLIDELLGKQKSATVAKIREEECIGCTKCIAACPTDAIIGASKFMHTIIIDACIGCESCVAPCPVDCIDMIPVDKPTVTQRQTQIDYWKSRHDQQQRRLARDKIELSQKHAQAKLVTTPKQTVTARRKAIQDAVARVNAKRKKHESR